MGITDSVPIQKHWVATVCAILFFDMHKQLQPIFVYVRLYFCRFYRIAVLQILIFKGISIVSPFFCFICHDMIFDEVIFAPGYDCSMNVLANVAYP